LTQPAKVPNTTEPLSLPAADLLSDDAVFRRTRRGQRRLLASNDPWSSPTLRLLARVNGYTNLRSLIEMAPGEARDIARAVRELVAAEMIELVPADDDQYRRRDTI
jgi:hypothetical protein